MIYLVHIDLSDSNEEHVEGEGEGQQELNDRP